LALSFVASVAAFFLTLLALDNGVFDFVPTPDDQPAITRVGAFAAPALSASAEVLVALRPIPAPSAPKSARPSGGVAPSRVVEEAKGALVPPMLPRQPMEPVLASDEPPEPRHHSRKPESKPAAAPAKVAQQQQRATPAQQLPAPLDNTTRSALGGPTVAPGITISKD
jgi:hypothetical protein